MPGMQSGEASDKKAAEEGAAQNGHKVADVHGHRSDHAKQTINQKVFY